MHYGIARTCEIEFSNTLVFPTVTTSLHSKGKSNGTHCHADIGQAQNSASTAW